MANIAPIHAHFWGGGQGTSVGNDRFWKCAIYFDSFNFLSLTIHLWISINLNLTRIQLLLIVELKSYEIDPLKIFLNLRAIDQWIRMMS